MERSCPVWRRLFKHSVHLNLKLSDDVLSVRKFLIAHYLKMFLITFSCLYLFPSKLFDFCTHLIWLFLAQSGIKWTCFWLRVGSKGLAPSKLVMVYKQISICNFWSINLVVWHLSCCWLRMIGELLGIIGMLVCLNCSFVTSNLTQMFHLS